MDVSLGSVDHRTARVLEVLGASGLALVVALALAVILVGGPLAGELVAFQQQRNDAVATIAASSAALDTTAAAAAGAGTSLADGEAALRDAATVTRQLADAAAGLGAFSSGFADTASRSRALSDELTRTADAMHQNGADSQAVASSLRALARQLDDLSASLDRAGGGDSPIPAWLGAPLLLVLLLVLLGWFAAASATCLVIGRRARGLDRPRPINRY